jgi:hypothetical protein
MKKFMEAVCDFFVEWGEYKYEQAKKRQFRWY